jgi:dipeptidyl-peptidase-4
MTRCRDVGIVLRLRSGQVSRAGRAALPAVVAALASLTLVAQSPSPLNAELERIFAREEYTPQTFTQPAWIDGGARYAAVEPSTSAPGAKDAKDIVEYDTATGTRTVLVAATSLKPAGAAAPLAIDGYAWSADRTKLLLYTNSKKVWRQNTRGDYWVLDRASGTLRQLGAGAAPATLMFAKFSPDGRRVGYVRDRDLYVEDVASGAVTRLTKAENEQIINGTSDWVYEEELDLRDAFRWSPDGRQIAYWQFDTTGIDLFTLINDTDATYPSLTRIPYPKAGTTNSAVRVGTVAAAGGPTSWIDAPGDPRNTYIPRIDWSDDGRTIAVQQLNRLQNRNDVLIADAKSGAVRRAHRDEQPKAWVDVTDDFTWLDGGRAFLWVSEKDGWRHIYRVATDGSGDRLITKFDADVIEINTVDPKAGWVYFLASPASATEQYLYRARLDGTGTPERVTPAESPGFHTYNVSPDLKWAFHTWSRIDVPPSTELVSLPEHRTVRSLVDNAPLKSKLAAQGNLPTEFFKVDVGDGVVLDGWMMKPRGFDPSRRYPLLIYVYGEPAGQTVVDRWIGSRNLFHHALANDGFIVASVDNRGTPAPRGTAWRKVAYGAIGDLSSKDQAAAARQLLARHPFIDPDRVAIWGWSGGGSSTLNAMFRFPDLYKVGVSVAPVPDQQLYDTIYQERYMGLPQENAAGYRLGSPINFAEGLKGRLLIIHGSGDDNVHYQGTEKLVNRLVSLGKPFDLMVYPNRTHSISEGEGTTLHIHALIARYLVEHAK